MAHIRSVIRPAKRYRGAEDSRVKPRKLPRLSLLEDDPSSLRLHTGYTKYQISSNAPADIATMVKQIGKRTIRFHIGEDTAFEAIEGAEDFYVDATILCARVEVLNTIFNRQPDQGTFAETESGSLSLNAIHPAAFRIFILWVYEMPEFGTAIFIASLIDALGVFILAEMWMIEDLMQASFERLYNLASMAFKHPEWELDTYMKTAFLMAHDSNIRFLLIAVHAEFDVYLLNLQTKKTSDEINEQAFKREAILENPEIYDENLLRDVATFFTKETALLLEHSHRPMSNTARMHDLMPPVLMSVLFGDTFLMRYRKDKAKAFLARW